MKNLRYILLVLVFAATIPLLEAENTKKDSFVKITELTINNIFKATLLRYRIDTGSYLSTKEGLKALLENPGTDRWRGPYLRSYDDCHDVWGNELIYRYPSTRDPKIFDLYSLGPDGKKKRRRHLQRNFKEIISTRRLS